jgi:hypothetical protein
MMKKDCFSSPRKLFSRKRVWYLLNKRLNKLKNDKKGFSAYCVVVFERQRNSVCYNKSQFSAASQETNDFILKTLRGKDNFRLFSETVET